MVTKNGIFNTETVKGFYIFVTAPLESDQLHIFSIPMSFLFDFLFCQTLPKCVFFLLKKMILLLLFKQGKYIHNKRGDKK